MTAIRKKASPKRRASRKEKRRDRRVLLRARVDFELLSEDTFLFEHTHNVSRGGIFLATRNPLPIGTTMNLRFTLPGGRQRIIVVTGRVTWVNYYKPGGVNLNPGMGIEFIDLSEQDREAITNLVKRKALLADK